MSLKRRFDAVVGEMMGFVNGLAAGILQLIDDPPLCTAAYGTQRESLFAELLAEAG